MATIKTSPTNSVAKPNNRANATCSSVGGPRSSGARADPPRNGPLPLGRRTVDRAGQRALPHHTVILLGPLFAQTVEPHLAREHHLVHREALRTQVRVEEVEGEDEADGEQRLLAVDEHGHVKRPAREDA